MKRRKRDVINEKISFANFVFLFLCFLQQTALYVSERAAPIREKVKQTFLIMRHTYTIQQSKSFITDIAFLFYITYCLY